MTTELEHKAARERRYDLRTPIIRAIYDVCQAIEQCGASEKLTRAVTLAGALMEPVRVLLEERDALRAREWEPRDEDKRMIEQFCKELNLAHDELLTGQGCANTDTGNFDWPEWTTQASSIRWAERLLGRKLAKTNLWTLFPSTSSGG